MSMALFTEQINLGRDISSLLGELSQALRGVLLSKLRGENTESSNLATDKLQPRELLDILSTVQDALSQMSRSPQPRIEAELCVLKICGRSAVTADKIPTAVPVNPEPVESVKPVEAINSPPVESRTAKPDGTIPSNADDFKQLVAAKLPPSLKSFLLNDGIEVQKDGGLWRITAPDALSLGRLSEKQAVSIMEAVASEMSGQSVSVRVVLKTEPEKPKSEKLQSLLNKFDS
jgi:DNA polymerase III gamma/tau subunit